MSGPQVTNGAPVTLAQNPAGQDNPQSGDLNGRTVGCWTRLKEWCAKNRKAILTALVIGGIALSLIGLILNAVATAYAITWLRFTGLGITISGCVSTAIGQYMRGNDQVDEAAKEQEAKKKAAAGASVPPPTAAAAQVQAAATNPTPNATPVKSNIKGTLTKPSPARRISFSAKAHARTFGKDLEPITIRSDESFELDARIPLASPNPLTPQPQPRQLV